MSNEGGGGQPPQSTWDKTMSDSFTPNTPVPGGVRNTDPDTSYEAADSIDTTVLERIVYDTIKKFPNGCINDEVLALLPGFTHQTISPRYAPLLRKGWIIDTGDRRKARSGRSQRVMKAAVKEDHETQGLQP